MEVEVVVVVVVVGVASRLDAAVYCPQYHRSCACAWERVDPWLQYAHQYAHQYCQNERQYHYEAAVLLHLALISAPSNGCQPGQHRRKTRRNSDR